MRKLILSIALLFTFSIVWAETLGQTTITSGTSKRFAASANTVYVSSFSLTQSGSVYRIDVALYAQGVSSGTVVLFNSAGVVLSTAMVTGIPLNTEGWYGNNFNIYNAVPADYYIGFIKDPNATQRLYYDGPSSNVIYSQANNRLNPQNLTLGTMTFVSTGSLCIYATYTPVSSSYIKRRRFSGMIP